MFGHWKGHFSITFLCLKVITAFIYFADDTECEICRNHHLAQSFIADVTSHCYALRMPQFAYWNMCVDEGEDFTCRNIKKYITILPSCEACSQLGSSDRVACYRQQIEGARCAIDQLLVPVIENSFTCMKEKGQCVLKKQPAYTSYPTTTQAATTTTQSTYRGRLTTGTTTNPDTAEDPVTGEDSASAAHYTPRKKKCPVCPPCRSACDQTGSASAGLAIGLFFLGLFVGTLLSCAICLFCPSIYRKSTEVLHNRLLGKPPCPNNTHTTNQDNVTPSAPLPSLPRDNQDPIPDTYHDLHDTRNRDSHTYSGLQSPMSDSAIYNEPGASETYDAPHDRVSHSSSVTSPTYQQPIDGVISGTSSQNNRTSFRHLVPTINAQNDGYDHTNRGKRNNDTNKTGNRYDQLQNDNQNGLNPRNPRGLTIQNNENPADHQYFVLEPENNNNSDLQPQFPETHHQSPNRDSTYTVSHNYFVLEKQ